MHWNLLAQTLALTGATVHPMTPGAEPAVATVLVEDGRILAVGPDLEVPEGAHELDLTGLHLVPGLVDGHANHDPDHDPLYLAAGITLVRDAGNDPVAMARVRRREVRDASAGPLLFAPGAPIDGPAPGTLESLSVGSAADVEEALPAYFESFEPDYLLLGSGLPLDAWRAVLAFADEHGLLTWGPPPTAVGFATALAGGQDGFTSFQGFLPQGTGWHQLEDLAPLEAGIQALAANPHPITPLLGVYGRMLVEREGESPELGLLAPHYRPTWVSEARTWRDQVHGEVRTLTERTLSLQQRLLRRLHTDGVPLVPGSGAPNAWLLPGESLLDELDLWVAAGLEPYEVLRLATHGAAEAFGLSADHGSIRPGVLADLVAVGLDPREGLSALDEPEVVVLRGRPFERPELVERVADLRSRMEAAWDETLAPIAVAPPDMGGECELLLTGRTESRAVGLRMQAEHFAVGRRPDGAMVYAARIVSPAAVAGVETETHLLQVVRGRSLESFDMSVTAAGREVTVTGRKLGALMNVEARMEDVFLYSQRAREVLSMVDVGTGLSAVMVGHLLQPGENYVLGFREVTPSVRRWRLHVDPKDHQHIVDAGAGYMWYGFRPDGTPAFGLRQQGNTRTELIVLDSSSGGGKGLALPEERVWSGPTTLEAASGRDR